MLAKDLGLALSIAEAPETVLTILRSSRVAAVLIDSNSCGDYLALVSAIKYASSRTDVIITERDAGVAAAVSAIKAGAFDYLAKPVAADVLRPALLEILERHRRYQPAVIPFYEVERQAIFTAMAESGGDKMAAARLLKIGKTTLYRKLKEYERNGRESDQTSGASGHGKP
ncbi:MAG TPA: helix-turn-helix domain-containing protein [Terriglobales bacterium]|nr:helix-turn-helix domain-containing protein [Terriglobales bacterium]